MFKTLETIATLGLNNGISWRLGFTNNSYLWELKIWGRDHASRTWENRNLQTVLDAAEAWLTR